MRSTPLKPFLLLIILVALNYCGKKEKEPSRIDPGFISYISAFTSDQVSVESAIVIRMAEDVAGDSRIGREVEDKLFSFSPGISGTAYWIDARTIAYRPEERLEPATQYRVKFRLGKVMDVPKEFRTFEFSFSTLQQSFMVHLEGLRSYSSRNLKRYYVPGRITTADFMEDELAEKLLTARQSGRDLPISWEHGPDGRLHSFAVDSIHRESASEDVLISWDGKPADLDISQEQSIEVPDLDEFTLIGHEIIQQPEQYIRLQFSDPLKPDQFLEGLIRLENGTDLDFIIEDNEIRCFPTVRQDGSIKLIIEESIKNILNYRLGATKELMLLFEQLKPGVRMVGSGVILPSTDGLILPFEAVNLKSVVVRVIRIFEDNVAQFLQVNTLEGSYQLRRAGRLVHKETVDLTRGRPLDYGRWNTYSLDLAELVKPEPGALYRIEFSFTRENSLYPCPGQEETEVTETDWEEEEDLMYEEEMSYWDQFESYYYDDYYYTYYNDDYNWSEREDPCSDSYYRNKSVARNVLASNLGIIAKLGTDESMTVMVTDLTTTEPLGGVKIKLLNYQQQLIGQAETDQDGKAGIRFPGKPFLLVAEHNGQKGYLKLDDGASLSLSKFDVSGSRVDKGLKGFLYGERGVWRPGDTLFLTFILRDKQDQLPDAHPVIYTLYTPRGQEYRRMVRTATENGFYSFVTPTEANVPTGNWSAQVRVGGVSFTERIRIETIKPNRLKIELDFGKDQISVSDRLIMGDLEVRWLHGATASNLRVNIRMSLNPVPTRFDTYRDYVYDDPSRSFSADETGIFDGRLDESGRATVPVDIPSGIRPPGKLRASFLTRVFEESGNFSTDRFSVPYSPYSSYVGLKTPRGDRARGMLLTDTTHTVNVVTLDPDGNPVNRKDLEVKIYKVSWRWWWDVGYDNLASYIGSNQHAAIFKTKLSTVNGQGSFDFRIEYPEWGRYFIRVWDPASGHSTGKVVYIDWPGWAGRAQREHPGGAAMLTFSADKDQYQTGETAQISIPSSGTGRALVSIENGSGVLDAYWVKAREGETRFSFPVTPEMAPNIYVNVHLVQPHAQTQNDLPIRLYGVIPLRVEDPQTHLHPRLDMPGVLEPESTAAIKVSEEQGQEFTYTLAMVDEGLLDLTRFETPDPWQHFFAREALGVKTFDVYDLVIGAYGGKIEKMFGIGGGYAEEEAPENQQANRFPPMVKFFGPFTLKKGQSRTHEVQMPKYVGSVRTMLVAGNRESFGMAEKTTPVRKPLMVISTLPRVLGPGESVDFPVTVFAMEDKVKNVAVSIATNALFDIGGDSRSTLQFEKPGEKTLFFKLSVQEKTGIGTATARAESGRESSDYRIELEVRNPNPPVTEVLEQVLEAGESWETGFELPGMEGTNSATLEISNLPPVDFGRRLKYLLRYPHGCVEQITSAAFPQLYLDEVMEINDKVRQKTESNVNAAINALKKFVLPDGSFGYWPNSTTFNAWGTSYAGHFLLEAEARGYLIPSNFMSSWIRYQKKASRAWRRNNKKYRHDDLNQAYRLYTLALAQEPDLGSMNRLREMEDLSLQARWRLAAAYALIGRKDAATDLIRDLSTDLPDYTGFNTSYGSVLRDQAMILETLVLLDDRSRAFPILEAISEKLSSGSWYSTQTTAYGLISIARFAKESSRGEIDFSFSFYGDKERNAATRLPFVQIPVELKEDQPGSLKINNRGESLIFTRLIMEGTPQAGRETPSSSNLGMSVQYFDLNGRSIDVSRLEQGSDFLARVTVENPGIYGHYSDMALTQIFPSGWEIRNTRLEEVELPYEGDQPTYQDIRDDRVYTYFDLQARRSRSFVILLNATYAGKYYLPSVKCKAMYEDQVRAQTRGQWVEVVR